MLPQAELRPEYDDLIQGEARERREQGDLLPGRPFEKVGLRHGALDFTYARRRSPGAT